MKKIYLTTHSILGEIVLKNQNRIYLCPDGELNATQSSSALSEFNHSYQPDSLLAWLSQNPLKQALILFFASAQVLSLPHSFISPTSIALLD